MESGSSNTPGMFELIFSGTRPITYIFISFIIMWLGIIFENISILTQNNQVILSIGYIFYTFGIMIFSFFLIGLALLRNDLDKLIRVFLIIAMISLIYIGFKI
ncbi:MAG: hypothetical protein ACP5GR_05105 [Thermoplasmata archaeon]